MFDANKPITQFEYLHTTESQQLKNKADELLKQWFGMKLDIDAENVINEYAEIMNELNNRGKCA